MISFASYRGWRRTRKSYGMHSIGITGKVSSSLKLNKTLAFLRRSRRRRTWDSTRRSSQFKKWLMLRSMSYRTNSRGERTFCNSKYLRKIRSCSIWRINTCRNSRRSASASAMCTWKNSIRISNCKDSSTKERKRTTMSRYITSKSRSRTMWSKFSSNSPRKCFFRDGSCSVSWSTFIRRISICESP